MNIRFHHFALTVRSLESSVAYYCDIFGFEVIKAHSADGQRVVTHLRQPGSQCVLELIQGDGQNQGNRPPVHLGFLCSDISSIARRLQEQFPGTLVSRTRVGTENILTFRDGDGFLIEVNDGLT